MKVQQKLLILLLLCSTCATAQENLILEQSEIRAQLSPVNQAKLSAEMTGKISSIKVREGQRVSKGDTLVTFNCDLHKAQIKKARTQLNIARNTYKGNKRMAELNAIGSVELINSELEIRKASTDVAYLQAVLNQCVINAPYDGVIGDLLSRSQEFIQVGTPILEILDDKEMQLEFIIPSRWLVWLTPNYSFNVALNDTGKTYPATLTYTSAKVDALSQTVKAVAVINGQHNELRPGMSGTILLTPPSSE